MVHSLTAFLDDDDNNNLDNDRKTTFIEEEEEGSQSMYELARCSWLICLRRFVLLFAQCRCAVVIC